MNEKILVFDSSTLISLSNVCLLWVLDKLKKSTGVRFVISRGVKKEVVDDALRSNRFKFSGMRIMKRIKEGTIEIIGNTQINNRAQELLSYANRVYSTSKSNLKIIHYGEMEAVALMQFLKTNMFATDERILRLFYENPEGLQKLMSKRLKTKITFDRSNYRRFMRENRINIIRSTEIAAVAYEMGLFRDYRQVAFRGGAEVLKGIFWALKTNGCGISVENIDSYIREIVGR